MNAKLLEKEKAMLVEYDLDNKDDADYYDRMLDECYDGIFGLTPSYILKNCDETAYRCGFNDYTDGLPERWECPECGDYHESEEEATNCCQEDIWECSECGKEYDNEDYAEKCCDLMYEE
jgi:rubredoxin